MVRHKYLPIIYAFLAAIFYGFSTPLSKLFLQDLSPYFMASLLYLGAGVGMYILTQFSKKSPLMQKEKSLTKQQLPFVILMIVLDILAPILLMLGLKLTSAANASLLNNLEIVATALIALLFFGEVIGRRMWIAILFILIAGLILSFEDLSSFTFSLGSFLIIMASIAWGLENNCTRKLSIKNPLQIVTIKGIGSGLGSLIIALSLQQVSGHWTTVLLALLLGFFAYGLSLFFYIYAQRDLGAARTSAYYATAPFVGVILALVILKEALTLKLVIASLVMLFGVMITIKESKIASTSASQELEKE